MPLLCKNLRRGTPKAAVFHSSEAALEVPFERAAAPRDDSWRQMLKNCRANGRRNRLVCDFGERKGRHSIGFGGVKRVEHDAACDRPATSLEERWLRIRKQGCFFRRRAGGPPFASSSWKAPYSGQPGVPTLDSLKS